MKKDVVVFPVVDHARADYDNRLVIARSLVEDKGLFCYLGLRKVDD